MVILPLIDWFSDDMTNKLSIIAMCERNVITLIYNLILKNLAFQHTGMKLFIHHISMELFIRFKGVISQ